MAPEREADAVDELRAEVRRLCAQIRLLEEEKRDLENRLAFLQGELKKTRAKMPRGISTS